MEEETCPTPTMWQVDLHTEHEGNMKRKHALLSSEAFAVQEYPQGEGRMSMLVSESCLTSFIVINILKVGTDSSGRAPD